MNIRSISEISNYRNMSGCSIEFDKRLNYIIGENNIGKTNLLELLNTILSIGKFVEADFFNANDSIRIVFTLEYDDASVGFFEDNFDVTNNHSITIVAEQEGVDDRISYYHNTPNKTLINFSTIRKINALYYYAQRMPSKEIDFKKTNGSGKVLNYLITKSLQAKSMNEYDIISKENIEGIILNINNSINSINAITGDSIRAYFDPVTDKIISRLLMLGDENRKELSSLGEGIQYAFNIILQIIEVIHNTQITRRPEQFEERLICVEIEKDGGIKKEKYFPLILLLDEPEIHQHPYRQRNITKKIEGLMHNKNEGFVELLRELFGIDGLCGQIIITTHSPNILLNDYKQFIRLYINYETNKLSIVSGSKIDLNDRLYKHLLHNYLYLKEAMFSKKIVFVEGDTEYGAVPVFASRKNFDLDEHGIGVIKLDGADSILYCMELYKCFGIQTYAIIDSDKKASYQGKQDVFFTTENDFEEDVYASFMLCDYLKCCEELDILQSMIGPIKGKVPKIDVRKFKEDTSTLVINADVATSLMNECKEDQLGKLKGSKNACKGATLAKYVTEIPTAFNDLIDMLSGGCNNGN